MFTKFTNKILEKWYYLKADTLLKNLPFFSMLDTIKNNEDKVQDFKPVSTEDYIFIRKHSENSFTLYYKLLRIVIEDNTNKIIQVSVLKPGTEWTFDNKNNDTSITFEVYTWYDVEVLIGQRCSGERYLKGNWNEYVFTTTKQLYEKINSWTDYNIFNKAFKNNE